MGKDIHPKYEYHKYHSLRLLKKIEKLVKLLYHGPWIVICYNYH